MKYIFAFIFSLALSISLSAQIGNDENRSERQERIQSRIESQRVAFITQKLDLSPTEAQRFWPIYNEMSGKIERFRKETRRNILKQVREAGGIDNISETNAWLIVTKNMEMQKTLVTFEETLITKLKEFLPNKKILKLQIAEREFKKELFEKLREKRKKFREKRNEK